MIQQSGTDLIMVTGDGQLSNQMEGDTGNGYRLCPLSHHNRLVLNDHFPFTKPVPRGTEGASIGLGDRLGIATPGHVKVVREKDIFPVFAQQSIRELNLTGRTYRDVLDDAAFGVFREGYHDGYGADADHLKEPEDIDNVLQLGFSMLTLDCSDHINQEMSQEATETLERLYQQVPEDLQRNYEKRYLDQSFPIGETTITYTIDDLSMIVLTYYRALRFISHVYDSYLRDRKETIDFEISIDETQTPTTPRAHFFVANELYKAGVEFTSLAPRFCGEFQKAIDYIGDVEQFESELIIHASIADHFGYRLSIHSGSDKFSVFPMIGKYTAGKFHVKTAGTNWLEAVRVIAAVNPSLYREMHAYALAHFHEATRYYHVTTSIDAIETLDSVKDKDLPDFMNDNNARQLMHITYGVLLQAQDDRNNDLFRNRIMKTLREHETEYHKNLAIHIGQHLTLLL